MALKAVTLRPRKPIRSVTPRDVVGRVLAHLVELHFDGGQACKLDITAGTNCSGVWRGSGYRPDIRFDKRALPGIDVVGDWQDLPRLFDAGTIDLVLADPPHQTAGGDGALGGEWAERFGTADAVLHAYQNVSHLFAPLLEAVRPILHPRRGTFVMKMADQSRSNGHAQLQAIDFVNAARGTGWDVCHFQPIFTGNKADDPRWLRQIVLRKTHCYLIVAHPNRCHADGIIRSAKCPYCPNYYAPGRSDQQTCGRDLCRQRRRRAQIADAT